MNDTYKLTVRYLYDDPDEFFHYLKKYDIYNECEFGEILGQKIQISNNWYVRIDNMRDFAIDVRKHFNIKSIKVQNNNLTIYLEE